MNIRPIYRIRLFALALVLLASGLTAVASANAQTAEVRYERALAREHEARNAAAPSLASLRSIAVAYENIVRRYPRSGYSDNALWQAAGVLQLAWDRAGQKRDHDQAIKLLNWLRTEYPSSSLQSQIRNRTTALNRERATVPRSAPPPAARETADEAVAAAIPRRASPPAVAPFPTASPAARETVAAAPARDGAAIAVRGLSHTTLPRGDRLTFEFSDEAAFRMEAGPAGDAVVLTVADARAAAAIVDAARSIRGSQIRGLQLTNVDDGLRVMVAIGEGTRQSAFPLYGPNRLVFDFEDTTSVQTAATTRATDSAAIGDRAAVREPSAHVPAAPAAATPPRTAAAAADATAVVEIVELETSPATPASIHGSYSLARQLGLGVSRIVIDPGHGGSDPGASANGITESALVLDVALRLEKLLLAQPGFEVVLTRRTNAAVPLDRRTTIANSESADLFLSIHANSSPRKETAGVETYVLNLATNSQTEAVAARENAASAQTMRTLPQLVRAITTNNKLAESRELAGVVQASLVRGLSPRNEQFKDLGVKQAPFVVLIGAQMPSVLAEIAFLTNRTEAGLLKQNAYKQRIAEALCDAILQYRASLKKVTTVAASAEGR